MELLKERTERIREAQFQHVRSRSKNVKEVRELRRDRARILTILRERV
ncbi:MAG: 50S ribosomal protein L29 [Candidatus Ryanbacteria bacterium]|nr:50S ribosomal protein L29 [Candidatus Ryanbacteria bacterium]